ncbi:hypothetical protein Hanom_Chr02g00140411 [Helianthus anomalus]
MNRFDAYRFDAYRFKSNRFDQYRFEPLREPNPVFAFNRRDEFINQRVRFKLLGFNFGFKMFDQFLVRRIKFHSCW